MQLKTIKLILNKTKNKITNTNITLMGTIVLSVIVLTFMIGKVVNVLAMISMFLEWE